ncbi:unnamed protein product [Cuscuta campestris]|uniref:Uncharacterized protein n=1 Tax=Cuscuta campestris TaxID=132261 RepID=A0A484KMC6_9ASTE|nr:unnamed protein product [Cuscuta campestris]
MIVSFFSVPHATNRNRATIGKKKEKKNEKIYGVCVAPEEREPNTAAAAPAVLLSRSPETDCRLRVCRLNSIVISLIRLIIEVTRMMNKELSWKAERMR